MENVPDMALDREMFILRSMVVELEQLGYGSKNDWSILVSMGFRSFGSG